MKGRFLNLLPHELQPGDEWDGHIIESYGPLEEPDLERRLNCCLVFADGTHMPWHSEAPMRIYRATD